jgi:hypothetical protein
MGHVIVYDARAAIEADTGERIAVMATRAPSL